MPHVLLTAFEPFAGKSINSSLEAARLVEAEPPADVQVTVVELPCVFGEAIDMLRRAIDHVEPDIVVATGQGSGRADITVERVAINLDDDELTDNKGKQKVDEPIVPDGPVAYFSSLPMKECVSAIRNAGIPAVVSQTAGSFLCNHVSYGLAHLIATERPSLRGGFVHIPYTPLQAVASTWLSRPPSMATATSAEAIRVVIRTTASLAMPAAPKPRWFARRTRPAGPMAR